MTEQISILGHWFLPNKVDEKKPGILRFSPNSRIELEIFGLFGHLLLGPNTYPIILGETNEGPITLIKTQYLKRSEKYSKYQSRYLLKGKHFKTISEIKFDSCTFSLFGLEHFTRTKSLKLKTINAPQNWEIKYQANQPIPFNVSNELKGEIKFKGAYHFKYPSKAKIKENIYVNFDFNSKTNFEKIIENIGIFRGFITLANNAVSFPQKIYLKNSNNKKNIEIIYANIFYQEKTMGYSPFFGQKTVCFKVIKNSSGSFLLQNRGVK